MAQHVHVIDRIGPGGHPGDQAQDLQVRQHAAANGNGAWTVSCHPGRLFTGNEAITALTLAERLAAGYGDDDPFVICRCDELSL